MPNNKKIRLAVDVNIWISSLLKPNFRARVGLVFDLEYHLVTSEALFYELDQTVRKPRLEKQIDRETYETLLFELRTLGNLIDVHSVVNVCRDPKDNFLLALAKDGDADYLITGDLDLLVMEKFEKTKILTLRDFEMVAAETSLSR